MAGAYARGSKAWGECGRSGIKMLLRDMVEDGNIPGLMVHPQWWEPQHPQELLVSVDDPQALYRPAPELSKPADEGDPAQGIIVDGEPPTLLFTTPSDEFSGTGEAVAEADIDIEITLLA